MKNTYFQAAFRVLVLIAILSAEIASLSAQTNYYFYIQFANKKNSPYSLSNPSAYLSPRAIARRASFRISCDSTDLPVNPSYLQQIENLGIHVHCRSKWMNSATVKLTDSTKMSLVRALPFVKFVQYTGKLDGAALVQPQKAKEQVQVDYGTALKQISQLNGKYLHEAGFKGKGIQIGVIDAGFTNVNINPCFDSLRLQGRLLGTKDIINPASNIYAEDTHGAMVLSTMTGNFPGQFLGTAPEASYWLIRTEYSPTEYKVETDFWVSGIEFADSVGVDVVNSSLGYYTFDDATMNFAYADMNGKVARSSRAATLASRKGIIVLVSAGNEGTSAWHYIGSPADAEEIITVGAIKSDSTSSSFSSFGPSADNRVKPDLCAMGSASALVNTSGVISTGNGTSFASPILAGMTACLLQRYKAQDPNPVVSVFLSALLSSGNLYNNPTSQKGYGIPDFWIAENHLPIYDSLAKNQSTGFNASYHAFNKTLTIRFNDSQTPTKTPIKIYSSTGKLVYSSTLTENISYLRLDNIKTGIYALCVSENGKNYTQKIIIQ